MSQTLNILVVEDSQDDAVLIIRELRRSGLDILWERIETSEELSLRLESGSWHVVISDYTLPCFDAPAALEIVKQSGVDIPFIVVAGSIGEELAVEMMKAGAHDYVMKDSLARLPEAVRRELRDVQNRAERRKAQELLLYNALHDPLTHLPNRTLLIERTTVAMSHARQSSDCRYAVLFLDLDRFKIISDSLGHVVGDQLLIAVAQRLKRHIRETDLLARLDGDEFILLLEEVDTPEAVVGVVEQILADSQNPISVSGYEIFVSLSIGIVLGSPHYVRAVDLIRDADIAMHWSKKLGCNAYQFFNTTMHAKAMKRLSLETDLRRAVERQELGVCYQPIISLLNEKIIGFEALVRWQHPMRGTLFPDTFIPIAEEIGLITSIDQWVFSKACEDIGRWKRNASIRNACGVSINLSAQGLCKSTLIQDIDAILTTTNVQGSDITLEITEGMLISDIDRTIDVLAQLAEKQIRISIDDFGTGYSSLSYLHRLPVHSLKIDRSFVSRMHADRKNYQVVSTILTLSKQLGLTVVAEGIETLEQLQDLQTLGCDFGQGYLFSPPLTPSAAQQQLFVSKYEH